MRLELLAQGPVGRQRFRTALRLCSSVCGACRRVQDAEEGVARLVECKARIDVGEPNATPTSGENRVNHIHRNGKTLRHFVVVRILRAHAGATGVWPTGQRSSASSCQNSSWAATRDGSSRRATCRLGLVYLQVLCDPHGLLPRKSRAEVLVRSFLLPLLLMSLPSAAASSGVSLSLLPSLLAPKSTVLIPVRTECSSCLLQVLVREKVVDAFIQGHASSHLPRMWSKRNQHQRLGF